MKWLVSYACRVNGFLTIRNAILPENLPPMNWIAIANRENQAQTPDELRLVNKEYALITFWQVSDFDASKWEDDGTGYLTLASKSVNPIKDAKT